MNEDIQDQNVLLVRQQENEEVKAVAKDGIIKNGRLQTLPVKKGSDQEFLVLRSGSNIFESFYENFMRQVKNPTDFRFFAVPVEKAVEVAKNLQEALKQPDKPENSKLIEWYSLQTPDLTPKKGKTIDPERVDWQGLETMTGIKREALEKNGQVEKLLARQKTDLVSVAVRLGDATLRTEARLYLREDSEGRLSFGVIGMRKEPNLNNTYYGVRFTDEDRKNLLETGNLGRIAQAEYEPGIKTPVLLSIDRQTNDLVAYRAANVRIPDHIKGVELTPQQKQDLLNGKQVYVEHMTSSKGTLFSAHLQFNAEKRSPEFRFDNTPKQTNSQSLKRREKSIPFTFRGRNLSDGQLDSLHEGYTVPIDSLVSKDDKVYNGYIRWDKESGKLDFMFPAAYKKALEAGQVKADPNYGRFESREREDIAHDMAESVAAQTRVNEALKRRAAKTEEQTPAQTKQRKPRGMRM